MDPSGCFKPTPHWYSTPPWDATRSLLWEGNNPFDRRKVSFSWWKQMLIDDRKGLFYKPKLTFWRCPSFGLKAVERENKCFPPKTNVSLAKT